MNLMMKYALTYHLLGYFILPLAARSKQPHKKLATRGLYSATNDWSVIENWFVKDPDINLGIACQMSGLVVCDVDFRNGGKVDDLPETRTVQTGNGFHYYYTADESRTFKGKHAQGIDIKWKGYVVAAPSIHPSGALYKANGGSLVAAGEWLQ